MAYPDNRPTLEVLGGKRRGVFALLDEECVVPQGEEAKYALRPRPTWSASAEAPRSARMQRIVG